MKAIIASVILALTVVGCGESKTVKVQNEVKEMMIDPDSAKFSKIQECKIGNMTGIRGYVNAKNRMGGYVGDTPFYGVVNNETGAVMVADFLNPSSDILVKWSFEKAFLAACGEAKPDTTPEYQDRFKGN